MEKKNTKKLRPLSGRRRQSTEQGTLVCQWTTLGADGHQEPTARVQNKISFLFDFFKVSYTSSKNHIIYH